MLWYIIQILFIRNCIVIYVAKMFQDQILTKELQLLQIFLITNVLL
jgi:hypothetical protein